MCLTCRKLHCKPYNYPKKATLTLNQLVFKRMFNYSSSNDGFINNQMFVESEISYLTRLMGHFWERWRKANLPEYHSTKQKVSSNLMVKV